VSFVRQIGILLVLLVAAGGGYAVYERTGENNTGGGQGSARGGRPPAPVEIEVAALRQIEDRIEAVGTTLARRAVEIVPMATGRVVEILFEPGQTVAANDILVRLDEDIQRADLAEARARFSEAQLALERARTLARSNTISKATLEQLEAALAIARAQVDRAARRLADRRIEAPFSGIVGLSGVETGTRIDEQTMITTLDDLSRVEIEFALPETVFGKIRKGLPITAGSAAFPGREFNGALTSIDSRINTVSRSFKVRAIVPNEEMILPAGMFMHLAVILDTRTGLVVAEEAILTQGSTSFLYVFDDGKAAKRTVTLGKREFGRVEITAGISVGELVIIRGIQRLRDGAPARLVGEAAETVGSKKDGDGDQRKGSS